ncbi:MAG: hypothetical protein IJ468_04610 [Lachnospiraceae bacterium]|nr:hypothetical protein [Lachnospiraceae bacterium]
MKKCILRILMLCLLIGCANNCFAEESVSYEEKVQYLKSIGCTDEYLEIRDTKTIEQVYEQLVGKNVKFVDNVRVKQNANQRSIPTGTIDDSMFFWEIGVFCEEDADGNMTALDVEPYGRWIEMPINRLTDAVTVNWDSDLFSLNYFYVSATGLAQLYDGTTEYIEYYNNEYPAYVTEGGVGYTAPISKNLYKNISVSSMIQLIPKAGAFTEGVEISVPIIATYYHQLIELEVSFGVELGDGTLGGAGQVTIVDGEYDSAGTWANGTFIGLKLQAPGFS